MCAGKPRYSGGLVTIDTDKYNSAWLAFSSDAWPVSVLNAYKARRGTKAPLRRD